MRCKHGWRGNNCNYQHTAPCEKIHAPIPCNYPPAIWKYPITTEIFANILCNSESAATWDATEFTLRAQCSKDPHKNNIKHHHNRKQTSFITNAALQTQPLQTNHRKPPVSITLIILHTPLIIPTLIPITQFFATPTLGPRAPLTKTHRNPYHQDTISVGSTLRYNNPPHLPQYYR